MLPRLAPDDHADRAVADPMIASDSTTRLTSGDSGSDPPDVLHGERRGRAVATSRGSSLGRHVGQILSMSPEEQVGGIAAGPVVATMADQHAIRDGAVGQAPSQPVCSHGPAVDLKVAVARRLFRALPFPASVRSPRPVDPGPEVDMGVVGTLSEGAEGAGKRFAALAFLPAGIVAVTHCAAQLAAAFTSGDRTDRFKGRHRFSLSGVIRKSTGRAATRFRGRTLNIALEA